METTFRWRSWLGASVIFFLIFGVINVGLAIAVPTTLHLNGSFPGVVFGAGDAQLLGRSFAGLRHDNPKLDTLVVDSMTSMCAMMMSWEITILATQAGRVLTEQRHRGRLGRRRARDRHEAADEARQHGHTCTRKP